MIRLNKIRLGSIVALLFVGMFALTPAVGFGKWIVPSVKVISSPATSLSTMASVPMPTILSM